VKQTGPLVSSGVLLGAGLGGFFDGIALHQILQWHNMFSSIEPPTDLVSMKFNMLWDGVFHALTWLLTCAGLRRLWVAARRPDVLLSSRVLVGGLLLGWGLFNSIEGIVDHQLLGIHHVHPGAQQLAWDVGFIASGLVMCLAGWRSIRSAPVA
jgi:uncharacterized membrane protein